jgi:hypothetical protein
VAIPVGRSTRAVVLGENPLDLFEHLPGHDRGVLTGERFVAQLLPADVQRIGQQTVQIDRVPLTPITLLATAGHPGLPSPSPMGEFLGDRDEGHLFEVEVEKAPNLVGLLLIDGEAPTPATTS